MVIKYTYSRHRSVSTQTDSPPAKRRRVIDEANEGDTCCTQEAPHSNVAVQISTRTSSTEPSHLDLLSDVTQTLPSSPQPDTRPTEHSQLRKSAHYNSSSPDPSHPNIETNKEWKAKKPSKPAKFTQMTLDLGQRIDKTCWLCGMNYRPSNHEDCRLHQQYHSRGTLGSPMLTQTLRKSLIEENCVWRGNQDAFIAEVKRRDSNAKRRFAERALDIVERELGGVGIPKEELWSLSNGAIGDERGNSWHKYKAYLYIRSNKCIGACLAQRIEKARCVVSSAASETVCVPRIEEQNGRTPRGDGAIRISDEDSPAMLGISRIWTSNGSRRQGIARMLLDCTIENFEFAISIPKGKVAFSQPTDSGAKLARSWFGKESGWLVYAE